MSDLDFLGVQDIVIASCEIFWEARGLEKSLIESHCFLGENDLLYERNLISIFFFIPMHTFKIICSKQSLDPEGHQACKDKQKPQMLTTLLNEKDKHNKSHLSR